MTIPKVLYHGTTALRYTMMKKSGKMDSHTPKHYERDRKKIDGYLFFTDSIREAAYYGINTLVTDLRMTESELKLVKAYNDPRFSQTRDSIVLAIRTSPVKHGFEIDPEYYTQCLPSYEEKKIESLAKKDIETYTKLNEQKCEVWYRHKGDLPLKYVIPYKYMPYSMISENQPKLLDTLNMAVDLTELLDADTRLPLG